MTATAVPDECSAGGDRLESVSSRRRRNLELVTTRFVGCAECPAERAHFFCDLPEPTRRSIQASSFSAAYPADAVLFTEGQAPRGVFVICSGRVKLSASSAHGRTIVVGIAEAGEILGASSLIAGQSYPVTAETIERCQTTFIRGDDFLRLVSTSPEVAGRTLVQLSKEVYESADTLRYVGFSEAAADKLVRLLAGWSRRRGVATANGIHLRRTETYETIAQMIGTSRHTVTRGFGSLRRRRIIEFCDSGLLIRDPSALAERSSSKRPC